MAEKLARYRRMRDFGATAEPAGGAEPDAAGGDRFVIQEHHATRLHWDLRLEREGVLVSWAVPNGIPADPDENRKAVHTEDHPLEYLDFEGDIPEGSYGAGTMRIWDRGTYEVEKWEPRKHVLTFHGERVRGRYALFQTGEGKDWMLHRMDPPEDPDREPMPAHVEPMAPEPGRLPADEDEWGFEIRWAGERALAYGQPGRIRLESAAREDLTARFGEVRRLDRALGAHEAVLDGVLVAFGPDGRPDPDRLARRLPAESDSTRRRLAKALPAVHVIFDLLYLDGSSLVDRPYEERRARLEELDLEGTAWRVPAYHRGDGRALLAASRSQGLDGLVAKRLDSRYVPGGRGEGWIEVREA